MFISIGDMIALALPSNTEIKYPRPNGIKSLKKAVREETFPYPAKSTLQTAFVIFNIITKDIYIYRITS